MPLTENQKVSLKRYREKNKEKIKTSQALYREKNRERLRKLNRETYYKDIEKSRQRGRMYSIKNKDRILEYRKDYMRTPQGRLTSVKGSAKVRGIEYKLSSEHALGLLSGRCHYCREFDTQIGIDRLDSSIGYLPENCVSCCTKCNYMKGVYSYKDFIGQCKKISQTHTVD